MMSFKTTFLTAVCLGIFGLTLSAQSVEVRGNVGDGETLLPLKDVLVTLQPGGQQTITNEDGNFVFYDVPPGSIDISFQADGHVLQTISVEINERSIQEENGKQILPLQPVSLAPLQQKSDILTKEDFIPVINLSDEDLDQENDNQNISGVLSASNDIFVSTAAFTFGASRFRIRGLDSENNLIYINGAPLNELENGQIFWSAWGGLNDVFRNRENEIGLGVIPFSFGGIGGATILDTRAATQRKQTRLTLSASNRSFRYRTMLTHSTGMLNSGWAFSFSGSHRWADEGYVPGTFYDSWSYFASIDRKLGDKQKLNLTVFGSPTQRGRSGPGTAEMNDIAGTNYYNPYWGYQEGEKRNSRVNNAHQPMFILRHDWKMDKKTNLMTALSYQFGRNGGTSLDWFDAPDPRPDYYRYLPSFLASQSEEAAAIQDAYLRADEANRQINWADLYEVNRNSQLGEKFDYLLDGQEVAGKWSQYIIEDRRFDSKELNFNTILEKILSDQVSIDAGFSYQAHTVEYFKVLEDLLGGDYYVNVDKFAVRDSVGNLDAQQLDLNNPSQIIREGDVFGYHHDIDIRKSNLWAQLVFNLRKFDFFVGASASSSQFWRTGYYKNGKFPNNSFGESEKQNYFNYGLKGGLTFKIDGRNYLFANGLHSTRAPFVRNAYVSPNTRDQLVPNLMSETISSAEAGYLLRSPNVKARASVYWVQFQDQLRVVRFYNDFERAFGNLVLSGIDKRHIGTELAIETKLTSSLSVNAVAAIGQYIFNSRMKAETFLDNEADLSSSISEFTVYSENFYVDDSPQEAYTFGLQYRPKGFWFAYLNVNYFDGMYVDFSPIRRSIDAVINLDPTSDTFTEIIEQEKLDAALTVDLSLGKSFKFGDLFMVINIGISNLLDNQDFITGGYEQLRFDVRERDVDAYPSRYFYNYGRNYFVNLSLSL
ncbi:MAG TPA: TonB-dependent receptor [Saprospiraceae bacterium]|nr:TonB-dependent receptor [Saprospiraceae bacterium]HMQ83379.1 TonB-dependent receptor [Saprospiraceae bacterium]